MELIGRCWDVTGCCFPYICRENPPQLDLIYHLFTQPTDLIFSEERLFTRIIGELADVDRLDLRMAASLAVGLEFRAWLLRNIRSRVEQKFAPEL